MKKINVRVKFKRKVTQIETGFVTVAVPITGTNKDVINQANQQNFLRKLVTKIEPVEEDWQFITEGEDA